MQIQVLASNKKEKPPFRESKLTRLLSNAIGGGAKTCLIICVAPTIIDHRSRRSGRSSLVSRR